MSGVEERATGGGGESAGAPIRSDEPPVPSGQAGPVSEAGRPGEALSEVELEALLFVAERPLARHELAALTGASGETIDARLGDLEVRLASRGIRLVVAGDRVALATAPEAGRLIARYAGGDQARLSPSMLETLAIVAYRQPVTRAGIERIRGVDSEYTLRSLLHRRLVVELGRADAPGRPYLYGTGFDFLERFGLASLDELPVLDAAVAERLGDAADVGRTPGVVGLSAVVAPVDRDQEPPDPDA